MDMSISINSGSTESESDSRLIEIEECLEHRHNFWSKFLNYYVKHNLTFDCLKDTARLLNSLPTSSFKLPETKYKIMKEFCSEKISFEIFIFCVKCKVYKQFNANTLAICSTCSSNLRKKETNFFVIFDVSSQLQKILQHYWSEVVIFQSTSDEQNICDITDGSIIKDLNQRNPLDLKLTVLINTDGVQVSKSGKKSLWPIQIICNFLPPTLRFNRPNIILAGIYLDVKKPDIKSFFQPLAEEFSIINDKGIRILIDGNENILNIHVTQCSLDLPAQAMVQGINLYNGYKSCTDCLHGGVPIPTKFKNKSFVRYIWRGVLEEPRTNVATLKDMENILQGQPSRNGVISFSCLLPFEQFDVIKGHPIDYMHCVLLGVVKALINHWTCGGNKTEGFFLKKSARKLLNERIENIKLCNFIRRKPRTLEEKKLFKASEYRSMLLYILPIVLKGILKDQYYSHFCLLSSAVYKLLRPIIPLDSLFAIESDLIKFVADYGMLYGSNRVTMNVHRLIHVVDSVRNCGPLWATSLFHFESNNAYILKFVNGTKDILLQIACKYSLASHLTKEKGNTNKGKKKIILKNPIQISLNEEMHEILENLDVRTIGATFNGFTSMNRDEIKYTSTNYTLAKRTADYFVLLEDGVFVKILLYFEHPVLKQLMIVERFAVKRNFHQFVELIEDFVDVVDVDLIKEKVIYTRQNNMHYVVERPNRYEKD